MHIIGKTLTKGKTKKSPIKKKTPTKSNKKTAIYQKENGDKDNE